MSKSWLNSKDVLRILTFGAYSGAVRSTVKRCCSAHLKAQAGTLSTP